MKNEILTVKRYTLPAPFDAVIAVAADLHGGTGEECLARLRELRPDAIFCPGDLGESPTRKDDVDRSRFAALIHKSFKLADRILGHNAKDRFQTANENAFRFLEQATRIAPTYYSLGNHDWTYTKEERTRLADAGVTLLDCCEATAVLPGGTFRIGGIENAAQADWAREFARGGGYRVLLCHRPELYEPYLKGTDLDLIVCGHAHGGQWRLFGHAIYAPGQGFFPKYTRGIYDGRLAVSPGLTNTTSVPRFGNPTELMVLELRKMG